MKHSSSTYIYRLCDIKYYTYYIGKMREKMLVFFFPPFYEDVLLNKLLHFYTLYIEHICVCVY